MTDYSLSQHDTRPARADEVAARRRHYEYNHDYGFAVAESDEDLNPAGAEWRLKALAAQEKARLNLVALQRRGGWSFVNELPPLAPLKLARLIKERDFAGMVDYFMPIPGGMKAGAPRPTLADYRDVFALAALPRAARHFDSDAYFAEMMVAGPDPTRLERMRATSAKFPLTSQHLVKQGEQPGGDLNAAIAEGRVFCVDYASMQRLQNGQHPQVAKYIFAPQAAFVVPRGGGALRPLAIQCGQDPAERRIYTPADGASWKLAKGCVLAAYNTCHEVLAHLGFTHLVSEPILIAALRQLSPKHPISALLRRHHEGTQAINRLAVQLLIQPGRAVEYLIGSELKSTWAWLADERLRYSFRDHYLPNKLQRAGTDSVATLPHYPYRDDGLLIWRAIEAWVADFVAAYYGSDAEVRADGELQAWAAEVASPEQGKLRDFGATPRHIDDRQDLIEILTMVLWTAGPEHAAVNFSQADHQAFLPANPLASYSPEPRGVDHDEAAWLASLPPLDVAVQQFCIMTFLGSLRYGTLGDYGDDFKGTKVEPALRRFRENLASIELEITSRNQRRAEPYEYLRPSLIPNSTNI